MAKASRFILSVVILFLWAIAANAQFTDWSTPVNLGSVVNSKFGDSCVSISKDGLSLFFSSNRQAPGTTNRDLYLTQRDSVESPWKPPIPLTMLNTPDWDSCPALSLDEHRLYFSSSRPDGCGGYDLWVSRRHDRKDDYGWQPPVNLGCAGAGYVNTEANELTPTFFEDSSGKLWLYFSSNRPDFNFYQSEMRDDGTFGPALPIAELNSEYSDVGITVRRDGLEVIFISNRPGGSGDPTAFDFWMATRSSTSDPWSAPVFVPSLGNPAFANGRIALSFDGRQLYFTSTRSGGFGLQDLWVATREKLQGK